MESMSSKDSAETAESYNAETNMGRRRFLAASAALGVAAAAGTGTAAAQEEVNINFSSDFAHDPYINGVVTVSEHLGEFSTLEYTNDNGETASLMDDGFVLAAEPEDDETPHNPVSLMAADLYRTDEDGDRQRLDEFAAFPRGVTYDAGGDEEEDVSILDATHWTVDNSGSTGTLSVTDGSNGALDVSIDSQSGGDTAIASFDLSTVGSSDGTITSGIARKFIQVVADVDTLPAGTTVEIALVDSTGGEVVATIDPDGDLSTDSVLIDGTGDSQVGQARVGELGSLDDIQEIQLRVLDAAASVTFHGLNFERESAWVFGSQEQTTTDDDGNTIVETVEVEEPKGQFSIVDLSSLGGTPFEGASLAEKVLDVEMRASELPDAQIMARIRDTPDTYSRPKEAEVVATFESPSAYSLGVSLENLLVDVPLPQGRYLGAEVATGVSEVETWDDVDGVSWTSRTDSYSSVGDEVELLASVAASDRTLTRHRYLLDEDEANALTSTSSGSGVVMVGGGSGPGQTINMWMTTVIGLLGAGAIWFRKSIFGLLSR